ncbi:MAG: hypothetical protein NVS9B1_08290 [Candidatus Dormibacteraceae bacterium]
MATNLETSGNKEKPAPRTAETPDLQSQLEALLDSVWDAEANWSLDDRIDLALKTHRRAA